MIQKGFFQVLIWHLHDSSIYLTISVWIGKINEKGRRSGEGEKECYGHPVQCQLPS